MDGAEVGVPPGLPGQHGAAVRQRRFDRHARHLDGGGRRRHAVRLLEQPQLWRPGVRADQREHGAAAGRYRDVHAVLLHGGLRARLHRLGRRQPRRQRVGQLQRLVRVISITYTATARGLAPRAASRRRGVRCGRGQLRPRSDFDASDLEAELEGGGQVSAAALVDRWPLVGRWELLDTCADLLASPDCDGIVIVGPAGVGKTRLAEECRVAAEADGWTTARIIASRTAATAPLGALAHLLPPDAGTADASARFAAVAEALRSETLDSQPGASRRLWTIDD